MIGLLVLGCIFGIPFDLSRRLKDALGAGKPTQEPPLPKPAAWTKIREAPPFAKGRALEMDIWAANRDYLSEDVWIDDRDSLDVALPKTMPRLVPDYREGLEQTRRLDYE